MADRFGVQHCLLETFHGPDIRFRRALLHSNAVTGFRKLDHWANYLAILDQSIECGHEVDHQVAGPIVLNLLVLRDRTAEIDDDLVARRLFIACREVAYAGHCALVDQNREFGCLCRHGGPCGQHANKCDHGQKCAFHDILRSLRDSIANGFFITETLRRDGGYGRFSSGAGGYVNGTDYLVVIWLVFCESHGEREFVKRFYASVSWFFSSFLSQLKC